MKLGVRKRKRPKRIRTIPTRMEDVGDNDEVEGDSQGDGVPAVERVSGEDLVNPWIPVRNSVC